MEQEILKKSGQERKRESGNEYGIMSGAIGNQAMMNRRGVLTGENANIMPGLLGNSGTIQRIRKRVLGMEPQIVPANVLIDKEDQRQYNGMQEQGGRVRVDIAPGRSRGI